MKTFTKLISLGIAALIVGCASPTIDKKETAPAQPIVLQDFEGTLDTDNWINNAGWQNKATFPALSIESLTDQGYRNLDFLNGSHGATGWNDTGFIGSKALKFTVKSVFDDKSSGENKDSHALLALKNIDLSKVSQYTGVKFSLYVPKADADDFIHQIGFTVLLRQRKVVDSVEQENFAVYLANVSADRQEGDATLVNTAGDQSDWTWFGDGAVFTYKVPFDYFRVPGWLSGGAGSEPGAATSIAAALTAGAVFNSFDLDFRFNKPGSSYTDDHEYPAYLDNVGLY